MVHHTLKSMFCIRNEKLELWLCQCGTAVYVFENVKDKVSHFLYTIYRNFFFH